MKIETAYIKFLEKVNKNYINDNVVADRGRFVLLFNEEQNNYVEWLLDKRNEDDILKIQKLLVCDKKLKKKGKHLNHIDFELPHDFFDFANTQIEASKGKCESSKFKLDQAKTENISLRMDDYYSQPSFEARETFYTFGSDCIKYYFLDFDIDKAYLTYYRYPKTVDIKGYIRIDDTSSQDIHPEFDDKVIDRILTACAARFDLNTDNLNKVQLNREQIFSKI